MITVNLRPGQKRKRPGFQLRGALDGVRTLGTKIKDPLMIGVAASWIGVLGWLGFVYLGTSRELGQMEPQLETARAENLRFKVFLADKRRQEMIRDSLIAQIATIRSVDGSRYIWPHLLDEVTKALPPYTWLVDMGGAVGTAGTTVAAAGPPATPPGPPAAKKTPADSARLDSLAVIAPVEFQLNGRTVDIQAYTKFLRQLEASPWVVNVTPVSAQTIVEKERPVTAFTIRATYRQADSAYIRTVPLNQSVR